MKIIVTTDNINAFHLQELLTAKNIDHGISFKQVGKIEFELNVNEYDFKQNSIHKQNPQMPNPFPPHNKVTQTLGDPTKYITRSTSNESPTHTADGILEQVAGLAGMLTEVLKNDPELKDLAEDITIELTKLGFLK